jgi:hypothetical protein
MIRASFFTLSLALATLSVDGVLAAPNLVQNGGFELSSNTQSTLLPNPDTSVTGWTSNGTFVLYCTASVTCDDPSLGGALAGPANGNNNGLTSSPQGGAYMAFDSDPSFHGAFTQTIAGLTVGDTYTLSFYMGGAQELFGGGPPTSRSITATLGNETFATPTIDAPSLGFSPWMLYSTTFTFTGGGDILSFLATGGPSGAPPYALLDGVSLMTTTGGTPEPATWVMILAGFGGLGLAARARRKSTRVPG